MGDFEVKCHLQTLYRLLVLPLLPIVIEGAAGEDGHNGYSIVAGVKEGSREAGREGAISGLFGGQDSASAMEPMDAADRSFDCL